MFEELKPRIEPDVVFTHARHDLHQDHRVVCELTWNTLRDHLILEYEIPKYDGGPRSPERLRASVEGARDGKSKTDLGCISESARQALVRPIPT